MVSIVFILMDESLAILRPFQQYQLYQDYGRMILKAVCNGIPFTVKIFPPPARIEP